MHCNCKCLVPELLSCTVITCKFLQKALLHFFVAHAGVRDCASFQAQVKRQCGNDCVELLCLLLRKREGGLLSVFFLQFFVFFAWIDLWRFKRPRWRRWWSGESGDYNFDRVFFKYDLPLDTVCVHVKGLKYQMMDPDIITTRCQVDLCGVVLDYRDKP